MRMFAILFALVLATPVRGVGLHATVLRVDYPQFAPISRFDKKPADLIIAGAALATQDNQTTGHFLGHTFETSTIATTPENVADALAQIKAQDISIVVLSAKSSELKVLVDSAPNILFFNVSSGDTKLRDVECRANLFHITPSNAMRADAVAQFASYKRWSRWLLVHGSNPVDLELAEEYRRAAIKFGIDIVEEREILDTGGSRRADTGHVAVQRQIPVLVQGVKSHDIVVVADASDVFAPYLPFHLWDPRPTMGSAGLRPVNFNAATESWGGTQFQSRFERLAGRYVTEADYDAWLALRAVGEAVVRTGSNDPEVLRDYILSASFELAAFKGWPVTFRTWNGQMRQPILLYDDRITVSVSPQEGFLHQYSLLDTLGLDRFESRCTQFLEGQ